jgi:double-strand break repair protein MRE11
MDSFAAFEEVLSFAKWKAADMLVLGGDVFHDNKPSRRTMHQTYDLLREYVLGEEPVAFQIISDQKEAFEGRRGQVNYEDPHFSVSLPVFAIHGNHDDPTREGGTEALAALDLLSITNFVNYFGKADKVDDVTIKPILMKKGSTNLALYGLGNIRDERLNRMWTKKKVKFLRPSEAEGRDTFFNILVLHQNRAEGRGRKNAIFESMIPEWMDVVIWGHEHECQPRFQESLHGRFRVLQVGSTVATSLVDGEAAPKHLAVLELREQQFRLQTYRLRHVRPFVVEELRLDDEEYALDPEDVRVEAQIDKVLEETVKGLVDRARRERQEALASGDEQPPPNRLCEMQEPNQVLCRVKVDRLGFQTLNNQRFGARFVGDVANPSDILLWCQRRRQAEGGGQAPEKGKDGKAAGGGKARGGSALDRPVAPDSDELNVEDLVAEQLHASDRKLKLLKEGDLKEALEEYVDKMEANAITELVQNTLEDTQKKLNRSQFRNVTTTALIHEAVEDCNQTQGTQGTQGSSQASARSRPPPPGSQASTSMGALSQASSAAPSARRRQGRQAESDDEVEVLDVDDSDDEPAPPSKRGSAAKKGTAKAPSKARPARATKRPRKAADDDDDDDDDGGGSDEDFGSEPEAHEDEVRDLLVCSRRVRSSANSSSIDTFVFVQPLHRCRMISTRTRRTRRRRKKGRRRQRPRRPPRAKRLARRRPRPRPRGRRWARRRRPLRAPALAGRSPAGRRSPSRRHRTTARAPARTPPTTGREARARITRQAARRETGGGLLARCV